MRPWLVLALILPLAAGAQAFGADGSGAGAGSNPEAQVSLPEYPKPENYLPFEVSATTPFDFFVDAKSISVGADGEVRYTAIAKSSGGALNITYEGMRCPEREFRIYAFGRADNSWFKARDSKWREIRADSRNAQRIVLHKEFFCSIGGNITTGAAGVRALENGGNPQATFKAY